MNAITKPKKIKPVKCRTKAKHRRGVWTEEMDAKLIRLREGGFTTVEIAPELGVTKNSVCGRLNRLGLSKSEDNPIKPLTPEEKAAKVKESHGRESKRYRMRQKKRKAAPSDQPKVKNGWRYIEGDVKARPEGVSIDDMFCNGPLKKDASYCAFHDDLTHIKAVKKDKGGKR